LFGYGPIFFYEQTSTNNFCVKTTGIGIYTDSTIELFADTTRAGIPGTVHFKGRRIR
jgi:hypothetical protein